MNWNIAVGTVAFGMWIQVAVLVGAGWTSSGALIGGWLLLVGAGLLFGAERGGDE